MIKLKILFAFIFFTAGINFSQTTGSEFIRGVDISFTPQIEDLGGKYTMNGVAKDALDIFKENGVNYIRLRLWHTPANGYCGLKETLDYAKRIKEKGLKFLLDFHYSDSWADPGKQTKPAAWTNLSFDVLKDSVYSYTKEVIAALLNQNTIPDMVQVGNEITGGMLWPDGKLYNAGDQTVQLGKFAEFVKAGINGVRDAADTTPVKIMIHIDRGGDNSGAVYFYNRLISQNVEFDVIGLSYYPWWHGTLSQLTTNLNDLATRFGKEIVVAETAYPWTTQYENDGMGNIVGSGTTLLQGYPATVKGQKDYLFNLIKLINQTPNGKGTGFFYWEPAYISVPPIGSPWENLTVFDFNNEALESINAFRNIDSLKTVKVKLRVNTATNYDTLKATGVVQVRGEVTGISSSLLPSGESVTWDATSTLILKNIGGDYWEHEFQMYPGDMLNYKIWTGHTKSKATFLRLGWEGPITPFNNVNLNARLFFAGNNDTTIQLQFYNSTGNYVQQYYSPLIYKEDSVAVLFRVNVTDLIKAGLFNPDVNGPVTVRGDDNNSAGVLSWNESKIILSKEENSVATNSFWSGVTYFPKNKIAEGTQIKYKFYIENSSFGGWESGIEDRYLNLPYRDTTLVWKFFNERKTVTSIDDIANLHPFEFDLYQNYPNPFNPVTSISFSISAETFVTLKIYNSLGELVNTLESGIKKPGLHSITWHAENLTSGIYIARIDAGGMNKSIKLILMK